MTWTWNSSLLFEGIASILKKWEPECTQWQINHRATMRSCGACYRTVVSHAFAENWLEDINSLMLTSSVAHFFPRHQFKSAKSTGSEQIALKPSSIQICTVYRIRTDSSVAILCSCIRDNCASLFSSVWSDMKPHGATVMLPMEDSPCCHAGSRSFWLFQCPVAIDALWQWMRCSVAMDALLFLPCSLTWISIYLHRRVLLSVA